MSGRASCPWCGWFNAVRTDRESYCEKCYHRSDLSRQECNCLWCVPPPWLPNDQADKLPDVPALDKLPPIPARPQFAGHTTGVLVTAGTARCGFAAFTFSDAGGCLVAGDPHDDATKIMVEWEREQLVEIACAILPFLNTAETIRVLNEVATDQP